MRIDTRKVLFGCDAAVGKRNTARDKAAHDVRHDSRQLRVELFETRARRRKKHLDQRRSILYCADDLIGEAPEPRHGSAQTPLCWISQRSEGKIGIKGRLDEIDRILEETAGGWQANYLGCAARIEIQ
jgi:hypothetical protein